MPLLMRKKDQKFSYQDYLSWPQEERWELINGKPYSMAPAPPVGHQKVVGNLYYILRSSLSGHLCQPFVSPIDVVLSDHDVVQPDILILCDEKKITKTNIQGPPDLIIEVLSQGSALRDKRDKKILYQRYQVREYLLIHPIERYVERFFLNENASLYGPGEVFGPEDTISLLSIRGIKIPLSEIFN